MKTRNNMNAAKGRGIKPENPGKTLKRLFSYIVRDYKYHLMVVCVAILFSSLAGVAGNLFLKRLIDDYILPMVGNKGAGFGALFRAICVMAVIYYSGVISTYLYNRIMIGVKQ